VLNVEPAPDGCQRLRIVVEGVVQGVGFRPFAHSLATRLDLSGFVANDSSGVVVEVEGDARNLTRFVDALRTEPPPLAVIERIERRSVAVRGESGFAILPSESSGERRVPISADVATCAECLEEMHDPMNRRFAYPFTNCTNCGPRFTIVSNVPYDRPNTTMAEFPMCAECSREFHDPTDRRFHAQPISCPACGPRLSIFDRHRRPDRDDPISRAAEFLRRGAVVAIKGLGGFHLAVTASNERAVARLRGAKFREDKPFAVLVADLAAARRLAHVDEAEERVLASPRRPIVLLARRVGAPVAPSVAPGNRTLGLMLPYTPLHHLLAAELGEPFVLTSGNLSDEPIAYEDDDAFARLGAVADHFLTHDRAIRVRVDDSVVRVFRDREMPIRRSRGYAPQPLLLSRKAPRPVLACGAELKSTFCLLKGDRAFVSHHIGDLRSFESLRSFREGIAHYERLFDVEPAVVAYDLHPEYLSTKFALELGGVERVGIQHHHAHVAACLADNGEEGPVVGVALDGLGFGADGTLWGGEFLIADLCAFERVGYLEPVPLPGGDRASRQPWRMAAAYLDAAFATAIPANLAVVRRNGGAWGLVLRMVRSGLHAPRSSSAGRLFDAVAAILGVRDVIHYEGQAAIELEQLADPEEHAAYRARVTDHEPFRLQGQDLVAAVVEDLCRGTSAAIVSARFHNGLAHSVADVAQRVAAIRGLSTVALSGGVFQNVWLLRAVTDLLGARGLRVLTHSRVPANDGGISFGQAAIAAARDRSACARAAARFQSGGDTSWAH
jgi:hydrogenase maturation protein HypF